MVKLYLDEVGLHKLTSLFKFGHKKIFHGTFAEWDALTEEERDKYDQAEIQDTSSNTVAIVDTVEEGNLNAVTSNAVALATAPVDVVELNNMKAVTSNAVAKLLPVDKVEEANVKAVTSNAVAKALKEYLSPTGAISYPWNNGATFNSSGITWTAPSDGVFIIKTRVMKGNHNALILNGYQVWSKYSGSWSDTVEGAAIIDGPGPIFVKKGDVLKLFVSFIGNGQDLGYVAYNHFRAVNPAAL